MSVCIQQESVPGHPGVSSITSGLTDHNILDRDFVGPGLAALVGTKRLKMIRQVYEPGGSHFAHHHETTEQAYYVIEGEGRVRVGEDWFDVKAGAVIYLEPMVEHELINTGSSRLVNLLIAIDLEDEAGKTVV